MLDIGNGDIGPTVIDDGTQRVEHTVPLESFATSPGRITVLLSVVLPVLIVLDLAVFLAQATLQRNDLVWIIRLFDLNHEKNVPTWYASMLLLVCALLLAFICCIARQAQDPRAVAWGCLSAALLSLSIDESAAIHEQVVPRLRSELPTTGSLLMVWLVPLVILLLGMSLVGLWLLVGIPASVRLLFVVAVSLYVVSTLVLDQIGSRLFELHDQSPWYAVLTSLEEIGESVGALVLVYALLRYLRAQRSAFHVRLQ